MPICMIYLLHMRTTLPHIQREYTIPVTFTLINGCSYANLVYIPKTTIGTHHNSRKKPRERERGSKDIGLLKEENRNKDKIAFSYYMVMIDLI